MGMLAITDAPNWWTLHNKRYGNELDCDVSLPWRYFVCYGLKLWRVTKKSAKTKKMQEGGSLKQLLEKIFTSFIYYIISYII